jgi:hypothetical protein
MIEEIILKSIVISYSLYLIFLYYSFELELENKKYTFIKNKLFLLEASDYAISKNITPPFTYKNQTIESNGDFCIYRIIHQKVLFCLKF